MTSTMSSGKHGRVLAHGQTAEDLRRRLLDDLVETGLKAEEEVFAGVCIVRGTVLGPASAEEHAAGLGAIW